MWLFAHIALSFVGIAAFATAAAAGTMYLLQRHELRSRRFTTLFRFFPPLATLDRVNHLAAIAGWVGLTLGVVLAATYSLAYHELNLPQIVWGRGAWVAVSCVAFGRITRGWQAQRAAKYSSAAFVAVLVLYVAFRVVEPDGWGSSCERVSAHARRIGAVGAWSSVADESPRARSSALLDAGASVHVVAPVVAPELRARAVETDRLAHHARHFTDEHLATRLLVIAATDDAETNARIAARKRAARGRLVNVVTRAEQGNCATPAVHRAGGIVVAVTAGGVPTAAARIRDAIGRVVDERYAGAMRELATLRADAARARRARRGGPRRTRALVGDDFCDRVEAGDVHARMAEWR